MNIVKEIDVKDCRYNFFNDINIKNLYPNNIKIDDKSLKNVLIYCIGYVTPNSMKPLYLIINKVNGCTKEHNENRYLALVQIDNGKNALKRYGDLWKKIKDLI